MKKILKQCIYQLNEFSFLFVTNPDFIENIYECIVANLGKDILLQFL